MMKTTMKPASLMEEIVVDLMSIQIGAQNVYVLNEEGKARIPQHHLKDEMSKETPILDEYY